MKMKSVTGNALFNFRGKSSEHVIAKSDIANEPFANDNIISIPFYVAIIYITAMIVMGLVVAYAVKNMRRLVYDFAENLVLKY